MILLIQIIFGLRKVFLVLYSLGLDTQSLSKSLLKSPIQQRGQSGSMAFVPHKELTIGSEGSKTRAGPWETAPRNQGYVSSSLLTSGRDLLVSGRFHVKHKKQ